MTIEYNTNIEFSTNMDIIISICSVFIIYLYLTNKYPDLVIKSNNRGI